MTMRLHHIGPLYPSSISSDSVNVVQKVTPSLWRSPVANPRVHVQLSPCAWATQGHNPRVPVQLSPCARATQGHCHHVHGRHSSATLGQYCHHAHGRHMATALGHCHHMHGRHLFVTLGHCHHAHGRHLSATLTHCHHAHGRHMSTTLGDCPHEPGRHYLHTHGRHSSSITIQCGIETDMSTARRTLTEPPVATVRKYKTGGGYGAAGVPVYVMLPLDSVTAASSVNRRKAMSACFRALKSAGVEGVMMDVWWGLVEREVAGEYNWGGYSELLEMAKMYGLKVQAVMSFHQCGGNVGDSCNIPLPKWVVEEINKDPDLAYTDQWGRRNYEYLSLGCDTIPCLKGRTPIQCYADYMRAFRHRFSHLLGDTIVEIQVGMGPAGELRYPSYPEKDGIWRFPGIGAFQCYDKYMLCSLKAAAENYGKPEWGTTGPTDAGEYNNSPEETNFFKKEYGGWNEEYGKFFLSWYSQMLLDHGERILTSATSIFNNKGVNISVKVAGIHWHYGTRSHTSELTAGYYNTRFRNGYLSIAKMLSKYGAVLNLTCIEMRNHEQPQEVHCAPENLVQQVALATREAHVLIAGENALPRYDEYAHAQILQAAENAEMCGFTYLRLNRELFEVENWRKFVAFVKKMKDDDRCWEQVEKEAEHFVQATQPLVQEAAVALML